MIRFYNNKIISGYLSTESFLNEIRIKILPLCYSNLLNDNKGDSDMLPIYKELLHLLDLKSIGMSTAWYWLIYLGYKYNAITLMTMRERIWLTTEIPDFFPHLSTMKNKPIVGFRSWNPLQ